MKNIQKRALRGEFVTSTEYDSKRSTQVVAVTVSVNRLAMT